MDESRSLKFEEVKAEIQKIKPPQKSISIFLFRPHSEMNIAHVFRLADAAGIKHIYLFNPSEHIKWTKIEKLSRKNSRHIPYSIIKDWNSFDCTLPMIALEWTNTSKPLFDHLVEINDFVLLVGNEQNGVPKEVLKKCESSVHIPMYGQHSSMNMAMATSIAVYQLLHA